MLLLKIENISVLETKIFEMNNELDFLRSALNTTVKNIELNLETKMLNLTHLAQNIDSKLMYLIADLIKSSPTNETKDVPGEEYAKFYSELDVLATISQRIEKIEDALKVKSLGK